MQVQPECMACLMEQSLKIVRRATDDSVLQCRFLQKVARFMSESPDALEPPVQTTRVLAMLEEFLHRGDLYAEEKRTQNALALSILDRVEREVRAHSNPLWAAARVAAAGNLIDSSLGVPKAAAERIHEAIAIPFGRDEMDLFVERLSSSETRTLLYILDNAGEVVFDRLFIGMLKERFPNLAVWVLAKSSPVSNDATLDDVREVGLGKVADRIVAGKHAFMGTPLRFSDVETRRYFEEADCFLAKGQANCETLDTESGGFLVLTAKCAVVAERLGVRDGDAVFTESGTPLLDRAGYWREKGNKSQ
jgi:uncharacterized protein with ATP-grasp and redox domains